MKLSSIWRIRIVKDKDKRKAQFANILSKSLLQNTDIKLSKNELKFGEKELRESEEKYRKLFNISPIGTALFDLEGKYVEVNDAYTKILGLPRKELLDRAAKEFSEENELKIIYEDINKLLIKGITGGVRELHIHDNDLLLSYVNTLLYDHEKNPVAIISMIQDITELKNLEEVIKEAREFTENRVETLQEPLVETLDELKEIPTKRHFFDFFRAIPQKIEQEMNYELEDRRWEAPKLSKLLGRMFHKSIDLDNFVYELESQTRWRKKFKDGDDY